MPLSLWVLRPFTLFCQLKEQGSRVTSLVPKFLILLLNTLILNPVSEGSSEPLAGDRRRATYGNVMENRVLLLESIQFPSESSGVRPGTTSLGSYQSRLPVGNLLERPEASDETHRWDMASDFSPLLKETWDKEPAPFKRANGLTQNLLEPGELACSANTGAAQVWLQQLAICESDSGSPSQSPSAWPPRLLLSESQPRWHGAWRRRDKNPAL